MLALLEAHLHERTFTVAERYTVADIAIYGYSHLASDAGFDLTTRASRKGSQSLAMVDARMALALRH